MLLSHTLTTWGSDVASLVKFYQWFRRHPDGQTDGWTDGGICNIHITKLVKGGDKYFVCVEVLWPSQPNGLMSSAVNLPNHTFTGQA